MKKPQWYIPVEQRSKQDLSLDAINSMLWDAVQKTFTEGDNEAYLQEVFPAYLVYRKDAKYWQIGWSILDGAVTLGSEKKEVEKAWVEARAAAAAAESDEDLETLMRLDAARDPEGISWDVTICEPLFTKNGWYLPEDVLRDAAGLFENVDVNLYELPTATHVPDVLFDIKRLLVKNKAGWIDSVRYVAGEGLKGVLHFLESAKWLGKNMLSTAKDAMYGLSYDCPVRAKKDTIDGKAVMRAVKFLAADSVDIVTRPAAGGKFNRAIAAQHPATQKAGKKEDVVMDKKALWDLIMRMSADLLSGKEFEKVTDEELRAIAAEMTPAVPAKKEDPPGNTEPDAVAILRSEMALEKALNKSELPETAQTRVRAMFEGKAATGEDIQRAIAAEKDYLAKLTPAANPDLGDQTRISVGIGTLERAQMAMDRTFGITGEDIKLFSRMTRLDNQPFFDDPILRSKQDLEKFDEVPAFSGLREMYAFFTGDPEVTGIFNRKRLPGALRSAQDINSASFTYALGNTLGRRLVKDYNAVNYREDLLISVRKPVKDFRQQEAVNVGYFPDLATVDPEAADYAEIAAVTDEESTYTLGQKGNLLTITRKTIINDDISLIGRLVSRLGRATRRTHGKYVWSFIIDNSACSDGTALFTSGHGNLGAAALTIATAYIAWKAMGKFTEKDSGERIGLMDDPGVKPNLIGPVDIAHLIEQVAKDEFYFSSNDLTAKVRNPMMGKVNGVTLSLLTDTNDWALLFPPDMVDIVEMGYLNGRQEPEMFVADSPQSEQVFVADKIRHKIRHEYAGAAIAYQAGYKAEVT